MNDFCVSLGDCGSYINYIGEGSNNIAVKRAKKISWEDADYKQFANPQEGKIAEPKNIGQILTSIYGEEQALLLASEPSNLAKAIKMTGTVSGLIGTTISRKRFALNLL